MRRRRGPTPYVPSREVTDFMQAGVMSHDLMKQIQAVAKEHDGVWEDEKLLMKRYELPVKRGKWKTVQKFWLMSELRRYTLSNIHPLFNRPEQIIFYMCKNKTEQPAYHCHLCRYGPEEFHYHRSTTICCDPKACWSRYLPRRYSNVILLIQFVNNLINTYQ